MITFLRTLFFFVVFWLHQILILPALLYHSRQAARTDRLQVRSRVCDIARNWGRLMCWLGGAEIVRHDHSGVDGDEAVLLVSNHQGDFDIPILLSQTCGHVAFVAKKELEKLPLVSQWMRLIGCIFLDREDRRRQVGQLKETVANLQSGLSMVIFPEGTRSRGPVMGPFAKGSLNLAERAGVRIVPVTLKNTYTLKPKGSWGLPGGRAEIIFHPAIDPRSLDAESKARLHDYVKDIIQQGLDA